MTGLGWLLIITLVVGGAYLLTRKPRPAVILPKPKPVTPGTPEVPVEEAPGIFYGGFWNSPYFDEGGIQHFGTHRREIGCEPFVTLKGFEPRGYSKALNKGEAHEVNIRAVHRENGKPMAIYLDGMGLRVDERWTAEDLFDFYALAERPGQGKPTSCNPQIQAIYDATWAAFEKAQAELDTQLDPLPAAVPNKVPPTALATDAATLATAKAGCGTSGCVVIPVSGGAIPANCEWIDWDFRFRLTAHPEIQKHWRQSTPVLLKVCNPAPAAT